MKIAYLAWVNSPESGVKKKIDSQIATWTSFGHEVKPFFLTAILADKQNFYKIWPRLNLLNPCTDCVNDIFEFSPDIVYFRDNGFTMLNINLLYRFRKKIIVEINSDYISEGKLTRTRNFSSWREYWLNALALPGFYNLIGGMVCVTDEIARRPFYNCRIPKTVVPNSIFVDEFSILKAKDTEDKKIRLIFLGTPEQPWHGLDKIVTLMKKLGPDFFLDIIGPERGDVEKLSSIPDNVSVHGYLKYDAYAAIISKAHIALSTLGLHRNNMDEACPLKSREYLAQGFPIIIGYTDPALKNENPDFVLKLPNKEDIFEDSAIVESVREFCLKHKNTIVGHETAKKYFDASIWEQKRLNFFSEVQK